MTVTPEIEVINPYLERDCDATPRDSFMWLFEETKKYNTIISVHGNLADEYDTNQSHPEFVEASVYNITADGNEYICDVMVENKKILLNLTAGQAVAVIAE